MLPDYSDFSTREASAFIGLTSELRTRWRNRDPWKNGSRMIGERWEDEALIENLRRDMIALRDDIRRQARRLVVVICAPLRAAHRTMRGPSSRMAAPFVRGAGKRGPGYDGGALLPNVERSQE